MGFLGRQTEDPTLSRTGRLAFEIRSVDINVWQIRLSAPGVKDSPATQLIGSTVLDGHPQFSPDGRRIVFTSDRSGSRQLWMCNADGSNPMQLTRMNAPMTGGPRWSRDGSRILFDSNPEGHFEVYAVNAAGGAAQRLTNYAADQAYGVESPDGRWIYFMSSRTGHRQIWKMPANGGDAVQVTRNGGVVPFPSDDGKSLYFSERAGQGANNGKGGLLRLRLNDGIEEQILPSVTFWNVVLKPDGIYYIPQADSSGYAIYYHDFHTGKSTLLEPLRGGVSEGMSLSPDGRTLLFSQVDERRSDLMLADLLH